MQRASSHSPANQLFHLVHQNGKGVLCIDINIIILLQLILLLILGGLISELLLG